jgi:hypothetical protein
MGIVKDITMDFSIHLSMLNLNMNSNEALVKKIQRC